MQWRLVTLIASGACVIVGCSLITSLDDLRTTNGNDASPSDGATGDSPSAADAGNLITNGSFENGAGGCGTSWGNGYGATFTRESPGRTGQYACDVCIQGTGNDSYELDDVDAIPVQPGSYYAEAWIATDDGGIATQAGIQVYYTGDGGLSGCVGGGNICQGSFFTPTGTWSSSSTTFTVSGSGTLKVDLHSYANTAGSCFAVDDVALYQQ